MRILLLNGPNLNLLGKREPEIYGSQSFDQYFGQLDDKYFEHDIELKQSNVEGELINALQNADQVFNGIILNPGGYSHTSVAIADAIAAIDTPVIEVHISNIYAREEIRHTSLTAKNCAGIISGFGLSGYDLAIDYFLESDDRSSK